LSQLETNPEIARIMHNDRSYPIFSTLEDLLSHPDVDPIGIRSQFEQFLAAENVAYPIVLVRDDVFRHGDELERLGLMVSRLLAGDSDVDDGSRSRRYNFTSLSAADDKDRRGHRAENAALESISNASLRDRLVERYSALNEIFDSRPLIQLVMPTMEDGESLE
jgi:hypothetical protein